MSGYKKYLKIIFKKLGFGGTYCYGKFKDFEEAKSKTGIIGYDAIGFVEDLKKKSLGLEAEIENRKNLTNDDLLITLAVCLAAPETKIKILDIGGGFGVHYLNSKKIVPEKIDSWNIIETKAIIEAAQSISIKQLKFFNSIDELKKVVSHIDLVILASSVHYLPEPLLYMKELCDLKPKFILITRTPLGKDPGYVAIQRSKLASNYRGNTQQEKSGNIFYPVNILNKDIFMRSISDAYDTVFVSENLKSNLYTNWEELKIYNILLKLKQH